MQCGTEALSRIQPKPLSQILASCGKPYGTLAGSKIPCVFPRSRLRFTQKGRHRSRRGLGWIRVYSTSLNAYRPLDRICENTHVKRGLGETAGGKGGTGIHFAPCWERRQEERGAWNPFHSLGLRIPPYDSEYPGYLRVLCLIQQGAQSSTPKTSQMGYLLAEAIISFAPPCCHAGQAGARHQDARRAVRGLGGPHPHARGPSSPLSFLSLASRVCASAHS